MLLPGDVDISACSPEELRQLVAELLGDPRPRYPLTARPSAPLTYSAANPLHYKGFSP